MPDVTAIQEKMKAIAAAQTQHASSAMEANKVYLEKITAVKNTEEATQLMIGHAKASFEAFTAEAGEIGEMYRDLIALTWSFTPPSTKLRVV